LFAGEQFDEGLGDYYLRQRFYNTSTGRFTRRDTYEGSLTNPASLHKYMYANANPAINIDPSGLVTVSDLTSSMVIQNALASLAFSVPTRGLELARNVSEGANLGNETLKALGGVATDVGVGTLVGLGTGAVAAKLLQNAPAVVNLRMTGESIAGFVSRRASNSLWNIGGIRARGEAVEQIVLGRPANVSSQVFNFPVIDDFAGGVATSIKSMDLTLKSAQKPSYILNKLNEYASSLSRFNGAARGGIVVPNPQDRVLVVAFEFGAATRTQSQALRQFLSEASQRYPNVKIAFSFIRG